ncbi:MAG: hypothetical protein KDC45_04570 [Bacteroidetes bacterium]|nr:hypothetical protein [Bacteroidota bacterium]
MLFGRKKVREGAIPREEVAEAIKPLVVNDGVTVERVNWDGTLTTVSGRVSHLTDNGFGMVEEGSGEAIEFTADDGDIAKISRIAISIDIDETQAESWMDVDTIIQVLEALEHGDHISVSYYDPYKGKGVAVSGVITLKDEYNKVFAVEYEKDGKKEEKQFDLNEAKIIEILMN